MVFSLIARVHQLITFEPREGQTSVVCLLNSVLKSRLVTIADGNENNLCKTTFQHFSAFFFDILHIYIYMYDILSYNKGNGKPKKLEKRV